MIQVTLHRPGRGILEDDWRRIDDDRFRALVPVELRQRVDRGEWITYGGMVWRILYLPVTTPKDALALLLVKIAGLDKKRQAEVLERYADAPSIDYMTGAHARLAIARITLAVADGRERISFTEAGEPTHYQASPTGPLLDRPVEEPAPPKPPKAPLTEKELFERISPPIF